MFQRIVITLHSIKFPIYFIYTHVWNWFFLTEIKKILFLSMMMAYKRPVFTLLCKTTPVYHAVCRWSIGWRATRPVTMVERRQSRRSSEIQDRRCSSSDIHDGFCTSLPVVAYFSCSLASPAISSLSSLFFALKRSGFVLFHFLI